MTLSEWMNSAAFREAYHCDTPLGSACGEEGTWFALWSPLAQRVVLNLYGDGSEGEAFERIPLARAERGLWRAEDGRNLDGVYYDYDVTVDGVTRRTGDPYARACGLNGRRSMVIDLSRTDPPGWADDRAPAREAEDVIYELHVRDFSDDPASGVRPAHRGKYLALCDADTTLRGDGAHPTGLAYLRHLGVTHVQLMPVSDFGSVDERGGAYNWGYAPVNFNVPEGSYATDAAHGEARIRELKAAIAALHKNGLRVVMDVVYNHTYNLDGPLFASAPWYFYRQRKNGAPSNGSGCGNEIASERSMCARYILDSVLYWAEEYHIDGFRFDLMGLLPVGLMNRVRRELDRRYGRGEKLLYGEPWAGGRSGARAGTRLAGRNHLSALRGVGAFCDATRDAIKGSVFDERAPGFVSGGPFNAEWLACCARGWVGSGDVFPVSSPDQTITYNSAHDDLTLWDKLVCTLDPGRDFAALNPEILRANRLAAAINFFCQGRPFLLAGEEFARTKLGERNSYRSSVRINRLSWQRAWDARELVEYYRGLIALRKRLPALCDKSGTAAERVVDVYEPHEGAGVVVMDNTGGDSPYARVLLAVNVRACPREVPLPEGEWEVLCDGESSFLWRAPRPVRWGAALPATSALILGQRGAGGDIE